MVKRLQIKSKTHFEQTSARENSENAHNMKMNGIHSYSHAKNTNFILSLAFARRQKHSKCILQRTQCAYCFRRLFWKVNLNSSETNEVNRITACVCCHNITIEPVNPIFVIPLNAMSCPNRADLFRFAIGCTRSWSIFASFKSSHICIVGVRTCTSTLLTSFKLSQHEHP